MVDRKLARHMIILQKTKMSQPVICVLGVDLRLLPLLGTCKHGTAGCFGCMENVGEDS